MYQEFIIHDIFQQNAKYVYFTIKFFLKKSLIGTCQSFNKLFIINTIKVCVEIDLWK